MLSGLGKRLRQPSACMQDWDLSSALQNSRGKAGHGSTSLSHQLLLFRLHPWLLEWALIYRLISMTGMLLPSNLYLFLPTLSPWQPLIYHLSLWPSVFWIFHIKPYNMGLFFQPQHIFLKVYPRYSSLHQYLFPSMVKQYTMLCLWHEWFSCSSDDTYLYPSDLFGHMNITAANICVHNAMFVFLLQIGCLSHYSICEETPCST